MRKRGEGQSFLRTLRPFAQTAWGGKSFAFESNRSFLSTWNFGTSSPGRERVKEISAFLLTLFTFIHMLSAAQGMKFGFKPCEWVI